jgi:hypothetical protein
MPGLPDGTHLAYAGDVVPAPPAVQVDNLPEALTGYRSRRKRTLGLEAVIRPVSPPGKAIACDRNR